MRLRLLVFVMIGFVMPTLRAQNGICKKDRIPPDYVPVAEFNSPECDDGENPFAMNAWRLEPVADGITVCAIPKWEEIGARVAELLACEPTRSSRCSARLDGLPNAVILRTPSECVRRKLPAELKVECGAVSPLRDGASDYFIAQVNAPGCPAVPSSTGPNAWLSRREEPNETGTLAICADDRNLGPKDVVVRRFNNAYCPASQFVAGANEGLTGWIIVRNPGNGITLTVCPAFNGSSNRWLDNRYALYKTTPTKYSPLCGGQPGLANSFDITFPWGTGRSPRRPF